MNIYSNILIEESILRSKSLTDILYDLEPLVFECNICGRKSRNSVWYYDYVYPMPMMICVNNDNKNCEDNIKYCCYSVLDSTTFRLIEERPDTLIFDDEDDRYDYFCEMRDTNDYKYKYFVNFCKIDYFTPNNTKRFILQKDINVKESVNIINELNIIARNSNRDLREDLYKIFEIKHNLVRVCEDEIDSDDCYRENNYLKLPVNSHNLFDPEIPYPENTDFSHDSSIMILYCTDNNGRKIVQKLWGD